MIQSGCITIYIHIYPNIQIYKYNYVSVEFISKEEEGDYPITPCMSTTGVHLVVLLVCNIPLLLESVDPETE